MPILGAHESIAGGYYKSVEIAKRVGCQCVQLFTKNNNQWNAPPISAEQVALFRQALDETGIVDPVAHTSYLINMGSPDDALWQKSVAAFADELLRCDFLGIPYLVTHPGAYTTSSEAEGIARVAAALDDVWDHIRAAHDGRVQEAFPQRVNAGAATRDRSEAGDGNPSSPDGSVGADADLHQSFDEIRSKAWPLRSPRATVSRIFSVRCSS